jgi:hypothetical protein
VERLLVVVLEESSAYVVELVVGSLVGSDLTVVEIVVGSLVITVVSVSVTGVEVTVVDSKELEVVGSLLGLVVTIDLLVVVGSVTAIVEVVVIVESLLLSSSLVIGRVVASFSALVDVDADLVDPMAPGVVVLIWGDAAVYIAEKRNSGAPVEANVELSSVLLRDKVENVEFVATPEAHVKQRRKY